MRCICACDLCRVSESSIEHNIHLRPMAMVTARGYENYNSDQEESRVSHVDVN